MACCYCVQRLQPSRNLRRKLQELRIQTSVITRPGTSVETRARRKHRLPAGRVSWGRSMVDIVSLLNNTSVWSLDLSHRCRHAAGMRVVCEALVNKASWLRRLNMSCNAIGESGGHAIADAIAKNTSLHSLDLFCNNIKEGGAKAMCYALSNNKSLRYRNRPHRSLRVCHATKQVCLKYCCMPMLGQASAPIGTTTQAQTDALPKITSADASTFPGTHWNTLEAKQSQMHLCRMTRCSCLT